MPVLKRDFDEINNILTELVDEVQAKVGAVSPWLGLLDRVGGRTDEAIVDFSMQRARDAAWELAENLAALDADQQGPEIADRDRAMALFRPRHTHPGHNREPGNAGHSPPRKQRCRRDYRDAGVSGEEHLLAKEWRSSAKSPFATYKREAIASYPVAPAAGVAGHV